MSQHYCRLHAGIFSECHQVCICVVCVMQRCVENLKSVPCVNGESCVDLCDLARVRDHH